MGLLYKIASNIYRETYRRMIINELKHLLKPNATVLDFGCDDGGLGHKLMAERPDLRVEGIDIQDLRPSKIKRHIYDGEKMPFQDNQFDCVIAVDVLHHVNNKDQMRNIILELGRVARERVVIKDQIYSTQRDWNILKWVDDVTNAEFQIKCSYCFNTLNEWMEMIERMCPKAVNIRTPRLPIGKRLNPIFDILL